MTRRWRLADTDWNHWPDGVSDRELWPIVAAEGLDAVEIGVYDARSELSVNRLHQRTVLARRHRVRVAAVLLSLPANRWPRGAFTGSAEAVAVQVLGCAWACRQFGLSTLGVWPGADAPSTSWRRLVAGVRLARNVAGHAGIRLAIEYKPGTVLPDAQAALRLAADVPGTGVLLDLGHAYAAGEDPVRVIHALGDRLWHVHLGDAAPGRADDDLPLGRLHDPAPVCAALDETRYSGVAAFDLYGAVTGGGWTGQQAVAESLVRLAERPAEELRR